MKNLNFARLKKVIEGFKDKKILVIGDIILDEFIWGTVSRISPEAPVPVVWVDNESFMPGGAANVANNITALGGIAYLAGVCGSDIKGEALKGELVRRGIKTEGIITDYSRPTTLKTRVIAHQQQVVRIDREKVKPITSRNIRKLAEYIRGTIKGIDALIIEDYGKGLITPELLRPIITLAKRHKKIISVDPKEDHFSYYRGVTVLTPNHHEASRATGIKIKDNSSLRKIGHTLLRKYKTDITLITLGEAGMAVFEKNRAPKKIPTRAQAVYDVSGAGDTVISSFTLSLVSGATPIQAAHIANCAAGIVVGKVGISVIDQEELINKVKMEINRR